MTSSVDLPGDESIVQRMMMEAIQEAKKGMLAGELPIGAIVAIGDIVVSRAFTKERASGRYLVHADLLALQEADSKGLTMDERRQARLYVTLEPCMMCFGAAMSFIIGQVVFGLESPGDGAVSRILPHWHTNESFPAYKLPFVKGCVLRKECQDLFKEYVAKAPPGGFRDWANSLAQLAHL